MMIELDQLVLYICLVLHDYDDQLVELVLYVCIVLCDYDELDQLVLYVYLVVRDYNELDELVLYMLRTFCFFRWIGSVSSTVDSVVSSINASALLSQTENLGASKSFFFYVDLNVLLICFADHQRFMCLKLALL